MEGSPIGAVLTILVLAFFMFILPISQDMSKKRKRNRARKREKWLRENCQHPKVLIRDSTIKSERSGMFGEKRVIFSKKHVVRCKACGKVLLEELKELKEK